VLFLLVMSALAVVMATLYLSYRNKRMLHLERMAALEKGRDVPVGRTLAPWSPRAYLLRGLIWSMSGVALTVFLFGVATSTHRPQHGPLNAYFQAKNLSQEAQIPIEDARKIVEHDRESRNEGLPSAVALLGLIPFAIGLAYLAFYYTDDTRHAVNAGTEPRTPPVQG
jgi:hypothetical protein